MSNLLVKPSKPDEHGRIHAITPESAGWTYVGFEVYRLESGQSLRQATGDREACIVLLSGKARVAAAGQDFGTIGGRSSPFEPDPWSLYAPARSEWSLKAETDCEIAVCTAPAEGKLPARVIAPDQVGQETRGKGTNTRHVRNILPETEPAESLLVVEVITPSGHWSSYPPHKHDRDALPERVAAGGDLLPPPQPALRALPCSGSTRTTARSTRRWPRATATWCWCRRAIIRSARRTATSSIIST